MLKQEGKLKELWKYFKKNGGANIKVEPMAYTEEVDKDKSSIEDEDQGGSESSDSEWDSSCSFDIAYEEL